MTLCFLRASGGVSKFTLQQRFSEKFSPRKRRCFLDTRNLEGVRAVFSAQAEVFLAYGPDITASKSFLRASGGVSTLGMIPFALHSFSPRKRRCFQRLVHHHPVTIVFSAQAEVFLRLKICVFMVFRFLRASGGVSCALQAHGLQYGFSPRKRRCF